VALLFVFRFGEAAFHTGWFVESLATQVLVPFVIRTMGRPWAGPPSRPLVPTYLALVAALKARLLRRIVVPRGATAGG